MSWATLILKYLAYLDATLTKRDSIFCEEASQDLLKAGELEILELVKSFNTIHLHHFPLDTEEQKQLTEFQDKAKVLSESLKSQDRLFESLTCELLAVDLASPLPSAFRRFDTVQWPSAMKEGLAKCQLALDIISQLKLTNLLSETILCCEAFYQGQQGEVYFYCRQLESASAISEENLKIYKVLSSCILDDRDKSRVTACQAITHKNIARAQRELMCYEKARKHCEKALKFFQDQPDSQHNNLAGQKAISLRNYASILRGLGDYAQAKRVCKQALEIFTNLRESTRNQPRAPWEIYDPYAAHIALSLTTLASILWKFGHLSAARLRCEEGLALFLGLNAHQQRIYAPHKAMLLYTMGNILAAIEKSKIDARRNVRGLHSAKCFYETAIQVYDELGQDNNYYLFEPYKAAALRNLADTLFEMYKVDESKTDYLKEAKKKFKTAFQIYEDTNNQQSGNTAFLIDLGITQCLFGKLCEAEGKKSEAKTMFQSCVANCEEGLRNLGEKDHYALHKSKIEPAYQYIIYEKAVSIISLSQRIESSQTSQSSTKHDEALERETTQLICILETLRQEKLISGLEDHEDIDVENTTSEDTIIQAAQQDNTLWLQLLKPEGRIACALQNLSPDEMQSAAFLWVHSTPKGVVCVTLKAGAFAVEIAPVVLSIYFEVLTQQIKELWAEFFRSVKGGVEHPEDTKEKAKQTLVHWGNLIFQHLPPRLKQFLHDDDCATLFVSPCAKTVNFPFEIIRVINSQPNSCKSVDYRFLGLRMSLPRVHSLNQLDNLLAKPVVDLGSIEGEILLIGDPKHSPTPTELSSEFPPLRKARKLAKRFGLAFIHLQEKGAISSSLQLAYAPPLILNKVTKTEVIKCLEKGRVRFWWHMGHGVGAEPIQDERRGPQFEYLALADHDKLHAHEILGRNLEGAIVHFDCCMVGSIRSLGGGRFQSLPSAALAAGAVAVLSSPFPMWEKEAANFSLQLYTQATLGTMNLGQALLHARRQMANDQNDKNNPFVWAPLVLWGNPFLQLALPIPNNNANPIIKKRGND